jgi:hypothetical protein
MANSKCSHPPCKCQVTGRAVTRGDKRFCSEHCAGTDVTGGTGACNCGHPECR